MIWVVLANTVIHIRHISGGRSPRSPDCRGTSGRNYTMLISARLQRKQKHRLPNQRKVRVFVTQFRTLLQCKLLAR